jgi:hypothetical protein
MRFRLNTYYFLGNKQQNKNEAVVASHTCTTKLLSATMKKFILTSCIVLFTSCIASAQLPQLYLIDAKKVDAIKKNIKNSKQQEDNLKELKRQSDKLLLKKFGSVMDKKFTPPCGNIHEYMSMARYYWPDPTKPDGKPYIKKDGEKNPANDLVSDDKNFDDLISAVNTLSWAYYFSNEEKYAIKAIQLIRFWFLDTATRMLPNLNHAQIRTGIDSGGYSGIIDTHRLPQALDNIGLLRSSKYWNENDEKGMKQWFTDYVEWMQTSVNGKKESQSKNNHGTYYDMQVAAISLFCDQDVVAEKIFKQEFGRIASQIEPDGKQPLELLRTAALSYSTFNLEAWSMLANIAETKNIDLWHYETKDGRSIKKAIDYLLPFVTEGKPWQYKQINPYKTQDYYRLLLVAAEKYKDDKYKTAAEKIKDSNKNVLVKILYE